MNLCKNRVIAVTLGAGVALSSCAGGQFESLGGELLASTGLVSSSQASSLFSFGGNLSEGMKTFSPEEEYYLGRAVSASILERYRPYQNYEVHQYLNSVLQVLVAVSDKPETFNGYRVQVLDSEELNAMAAPGGFIFITRGFLKVIPNEEALAAVLAHEVAHIVHGHGVEAISQSNLSKAFLLLGKEGVQEFSGGITSELTAAFGESVTDVTSSLLEKGYSRTQEYAADAYATELLARAGYNPQGIQMMLTAVEAEQENRSGGWMSSHPKSSARQEELASLLKKTPPSTLGQDVRETRFLRFRRIVG